MSRWGDREFPITAARGPNSPFKANQPLYVPGIGWVNPTDYGPKVKGLDILVRNRNQMYSPQVNRWVQVGDHWVKLTGYIPGNPKADPQGGGNVDAYGNPIVALGDNPPTVPESTPPQGYPFTGEAPSRVPYNVPPNENMYPSPIEQYNPAPNENMYPTPVEGTYNPTPYGPSDYPTPVENPIFNPAPQESQGYPSSVDYSNPAPSESIDYPTQVDFSNPAPNESTDYPTPVDFGNPAPNEDMVANPSDMYFTGDMGTSGGSAPSEPPMPTGSVPLPTSSSPPLQVINDLGYNPSYPYGSSGSGVPTQQGAGILGSLLGGGLGSLLIPGVGGIIGNKLGGMGARMLARFLQGQAMNRDQSGGTVVQPADQGGGSYDPFGGLPPGFVEGNRNYQGGPNEFTQTGGAPTFYNPAGYMGGSAPGGSFFGGQSNIFYGNPGDPNNGRFVPGMGPLDIPGGGNLGPLFGGGGGLSVLTLGSGGGRTGQGIYGLILGSGSGAGGAGKVSPLMWG